MLLPKRQRTRAKLLDVTQRVILTRGCSAVSLKEICAEADMSVGTIYNYYRSPEEIFHDLEKMIISIYHSSLDEALEGLTSPLEIVAASSKQTLSNALPSSVIGKMIFDGKLPHTQLTNSIRNRFFIDMLKAEADSKGDFVIEKQAALLSMVSGGIYGAMSDLYYSRLSADAIEELTQIHLRMLGIEGEKAKDVASKPFKMTVLPKLPLSAEETLAAIDKAHTYDIRYSSLR